MIRNLAFSLLVATTVNAAQPVERITQLLARYYPANEPGAVVLVERDGKTLLRTAYGLADVELQTALKPEHLMKVGSISKQFTAVAILKLAEAKKLSLEDKASKYLTDFPHDVTIEQLLTHTAGVAEYTAIPEYGAALRQDATVDEIVGLIRAKPLAFAPGTKYQYTNSAYFILGAIVEKASGTALAEFLRKEVLDPQGLAQTRVDTLQDIIPKRARGYQRAEGKIRNATMYSPTRAFSVGWLLSTVDDLSKWNRVLHGGKVLPAPLLERALTSAKLADGTPTNYGLGWFLGELEGARVIEHGGDIPGFSSHVLSIPERKIFVAVLSNDAHHEPRPDFVATQIATLLLGKPWDPVAISLTDAELDAFTGTYRNAAGVERKVTRDGTRLFIERVGGRKSEVFPLSKDTLFYASSFMTAQFLPDGTMVLRNRGKEMDRAKK
ncbi:MAG TPA: serine hydrolase [Thermoanaerobaculia bacterium]|jgi:CubicO group peptidase (beta-lactamase class C family)